MPSNDYGSRYYRIYLENGDDFYIMAEEIRVGEDGTLYVYGEHRPSGTVDQILLFLLRPNTWTVVYAANVLDGTPVALDSYNGIRNDEIGDKIVPFRRKPTKEKNTGQ